MHMMGIFEVLLVVAFMGSSIANVIIGDSIARDLNDRLGTANDSMWSDSGRAYNSVWSRGGTKTWKEHKRLFPASPKRRILKALVVSSFGFMFLVALIGRFA
jgi:hypothetical protein